MKSLNDVIEELFASIDTNRNDFDKILYPHFLVRIAVIKRRSPRHPFFEHMLDMGKSFYEPILRHQPLPRYGKLLLVFPERWLGVQELYALMNRMHTHPDASKFGQVDIITSSAQLLTNFHNKSIVVVSFDDDEDF